MFVAYKNFRESMKKFFTWSWMMLAAVSFPAMGQQPLGRPAKTTVKVVKTTDKNRLKTLGKIQRSEDNGIISSQPSGTLYANYARYGIGWYAYMGSGYATPYYAYLGSVVVDGNDYYFQNPFNTLETDTWIKGTRQDDIITVKTPQPVLEYTDSETGENTVLYAKRLVWNEDSTGFQPDTLSDGSINNNITYRVSGDSITQTDGGQLALCTANNDWFGYGDEQVSYSLVTDKTNEIPAGVDFNTYMLAYRAQDGTADTLVAKVGFSGDKVYLSNFYTNINSCVVGTRQGDTVTFPSGQYLGANSYYKSHLYFMGVTPCTVYDPVYEETYDSYTLNDKVTFTLGDGNVLTTDSTYVLNAGKGDLYYIQDFSHPQLIPFQASPATPLAPYSLESDFSNDPTSGSNYVSFYLDKRDTADNFIDPALLSYQLVTADEDGTNIQPYTFYADTYEGLTNDTDRLSYTFSNGTNIQSSYNQRAILLYDEFYGRLGVRSVYTAGGETRYSDVGWFLTNGISDVTAPESRVKREDYYDMAGRRITVPQKGFYIRSVTYADGTVKNTKLLKR